jgi:hypothetical protein
MNPLAAIALVLGLAGVVGCEGDLTEVLLVVDADVCAPGLGRVTIEVDATPAGGSRATPVTFDAGGGLPRALAIVHRGGALGPILVTVTGELSGGASVQRAARFHFVEGSTRVLRLVLEASCAGVTCTAPEQTCIAGACAPDAIAPGSLAPYPTPDAGTSCVPPPDAGPDAGLDGGMDGGEIVCEVEGTVDCNGSASDGCESALRDLMNCGSCGVPCARPRGLVSCETGVCALLACDAGARDCNGLPDDGCESDLRDLENCGGCGIACLLPHATASCGSGACTIVSCAAGFDNCDARQENGCEVDVRVSAMHCGSCSTACPTAPAHAASECADSRCALVCDPGWGDCDLRPETGCEASLAAPGTCGECGSPCPAGMPLCAGNAGTGFSCTASCPGGTTRCGDSCVSLETNPEHCGRCGNDCTDAPHASATCTARACGLLCDEGWGDCNGMAFDGCETPLDTLLDCGACGASCSRPNATADCAGGTCSVIGCNAGFGDCNAMDGDGCEQPLDTLASCGACATPCSRPRATATCSGGSCRIAACDTSFANCDAVDVNGCEANLDGDEVNCGACGRRCDMDMCVAGACDVVCTLGAMDCNLDMADGCEADTLTDPLNCGECAMDCPTRPNATPTCDAGACGSACLPGFGDCTMAAGCETDLTTSTTHCGGCGSGCAMGTHAMSVSCTPAGCAIVMCDAGFGDCDGNVPNGCEVRLSSDPAHCGECARACAAGERCTAGVCR